MKTKQEQIEDMRRTIYNARSKVNGIATAGDIAVALVQAGYGDVKQAKIDVLNKLKDSYGLYYLSAFGVKERMLADILNPMIEELKK